MKIISTSRSVVCFTSFIYMAFTGFNCSYSKMSFVEIAKERAKLINQIESYQSPEETKRLLSHKYSLKVAGKSGLSKGDWRPPFNMYRISIENYSYLGFSGELTISFFNNRLVGIKFFPLPSEYEKFTKKLIEETDLKFNVDQEAIIPPYTRVWFHKFHDGRKYVGWEDLRLAKEISLWISKYS